MHHSYFESLRSFIADYGYWAVAGALLLESAGLPLPGETILVLASFEFSSALTIRLEALCILVTTRLLADQVQAAVVAARTARIRAINQAGFPRSPDKALRKLLT